MSQNGSISEPSGGSQTRLTPTPEQQKLLERIAAQRVRIRERRMAFAAAQHQAEVSGQTAGSPLLAQSVAFAKQHPTVVAAAALAAIALGPRRLVRWAAIASPWIVKLRR